MIFIFLGRLSILTFSTILFAGLPCFKPCRIAVIWGRFGDRSIYWRLPLLLPATYWYYWRHDIKLVIDTRSFYAIMPSDANNIEIIWWWTLIYSRIWALLLASQVTLIFCHLLFYPILTYIFGSKYRIYRYFYHYVKQKGFCHAAHVLLLLHSRWLRQNHFEWFDALMRWDRNSWFFGWSHARRFGKNTSAGAQYQRVIFWEKMVSLHFIIDDSLHCRATYFYKMPW